MLMAEESIKNKLVFLFNFRLEFSRIVILLIGSEISDFETIYKLISNIQAILNLVDIIFLDNINMNWIKLWYTYHSFL